MRVVWNTSGAPQAITMRVKGSPGDNPEIGDWWFGVQTPDGTPSIDKSGRELTGRVTACYGYRLERNDNDYLFEIDPQFKVIR